MHTLSPQGRIIALFAVMLSAFMTTGCEENDPQKIVRHTVSFDLNATDAEGLPDKQAVEDGGQAVEPPLPSRSGYVFAGWSLAADGSAAAFDFAEAITSDLTLYAVWTQRHTVSFNLNAADATGLPADQTVDHGDKAEEPPEPVRADYVFAGWFLASDGSGEAFNFSDSIASDLTLYAVWSKSHTVSFDLNAADAEGLPKAQTVDHGEKAEEPAAPSRSGYAFAGWYIAADGSGEAFDFAETITADMILYAVWVQRHRVVFALNASDATGLPAEQRVDRGAKAIEPPSPTRLGYVFEGWVDTGGELFDFSEAIFSDVILYAVWSWIHTVSFDLNAANAAGLPADQTVGHGEQAAEPDVPSRPGYAFAGWSLAADGSGEAFDFSEAILSDLILYAVWSKSHKVSFDLNAPDALGLPEEQTVDHGARAEEPAAPSRSGYVFAGWYASAAGSNAAFDFSRAILSDLILYAVWSKSDTVSFDLNAADAVGLPPDQTVDHGSNAVEPPAPSRSGYTFAGWYVAADGSGAAFDFSQAITADVVLYAVWSKSHTVSFDLNAADATGLPEAQMVDHGSKAAEPSAPSRSGYTFAGWYVAADGSGAAFDFSQAITADVVLYAVWSKSHTVSFDLNATDAAGLPPDQTVDHGDKAAEPSIPSRSGYVFAGWYVAADGSGAAFDFSQAITSDVVLYAVWVQRHKVSFDLNAADAEGLPVDQTVEHGDNAAEPSIPSRSGYTFAGWYVAADGSGAAFDFSEAILSDLILYAVWSKSHTVSFDLNAADAVGLPPDQTVDHGSKAAGPPAPSRSGYTFAGWYVAADGSGAAFDFSKAINSELTLYAKWDKKLERMAEFAALTGIPEVLANRLLRIYRADAVVIRRYLKPGGTGDGTTWGNAAGDLKSMIDDIDDAGPDKIYVALLATGQYRAGEAMSLKDYVAVMGGFVGTDEGSVKRSSTDATRLSGEQLYPVFDHADLKAEALLYGVTLENGNAGQNPGGGMNNRNASPTLIDVVFSGNRARLGGGMYNKESSPLLIGTVFSDNAAFHHGGGMYNEASSPYLEETVFLRNEAEYQGGGMYNGKTSSPKVVKATFSANKAIRSAGGGMYNREADSPTLIQVTFSDNEARNVSGGGMYNFKSSPTLINATFAGNVAGSRGGGGMYNFRSSPTLIGATFVRNTTNARGGGMYADSDGNNGPIVVNSVFWNNQAGMAGNEIFVYNDGNPANERLTLYHTVLQGDTTAIGRHRANVSIGLTVVNVTGQDPMPGILGDYGGFVQTTPMGAGGSAQNHGLYVRRSGETLYYSTDNSAWFTDPANPVGSATTLPADAANLAATDARDYYRVGRPDAGAYEDGATP